MSTGYFIASKKGYGEFCVELKGYIFEKDPKWREDIIQEFPDFTLKDKWTRDKNGWTSGRCVDQGYCNGYSTYNGYYPYHGEIN